MQFLNFLSLPAIIAIYAICALWRLANITDKGKSVWLKAGNFLRAAAFPGDLIVSWIIDLYKKIKAKIKAKGETVVKQ